MPDNANWKTKPEYAEYDEFREKLILAAAQVIEEVGVDKLRLAEVAKRCGCVRQTVYRYFNSKKEITQAVLAHFAMLNAVEIAEHVAGIDDRETLLVEIIYFGAKNFTSNPRYRLFTDSRNSRLFSPLPTHVFSELMASDDFQHDEWIMKLTDSHTQAKDMYTWLAMQIIALVNLGLIGDDEEKEKVFIRNMIVRGPLSA